MNGLFSRNAIAMGVGLVGAVAGLHLAACSAGSQDAGSSTGADTTCRTQALQVLFSPMYSAYDGVHEFQIPAVVNGILSSDIAWSASDSSMVQLAPDSDTGGVMITVQGAGTVTITASAGDLCGSSVLTITQASADDWTTGNARYNDGVAYHFHPGEGDAGATMGDGGPACTNCHGPTATMGHFNDVAHTPEQTGGFSDQELIDIVVNGNVPGWSADGGASADAGYFDPGIVSYAEWHSFHHWTDITSDEQPGILTYLRSLTPTSQNGSDFGGGWSHHDGGAGTGGGNGGSPPSGSGEAGAGETGSASSP